jgi:transposase
MARLARDCPHLGLAPTLVHTSAAGIRIVQGRSPRPLATQSDHFIPINMPTCRGWSNCCARAVSGPCRRRAAERDERAAAPRPAHVLPSLSRYLTNLVQGTVCKILGQEDIKPHKVRYYLEQRDAEFEQKMAQVLCVYREVKVLKKAAAKSQKPGKAVAIVSYDEKPGIQAIATTAPDLPPRPGRHATFARDHEYKRHGTLSLLAGIDLLTGKVHALVRDRHRSREFIEFLKLLDAAYPASTAIKLILDNHSAHISRETRAWLATRPDGRFEFTFTPKHGSWLNLVEGFFSKFARSVLRHIRVASKHELKERIMAGIEDVNRHPVIHTWSYKLAEAA